jgi:starch phosphorylase
MICGFQPTVSKTRRSEPTVQASRSFVTESTPAANLSDRAVLGDLRRIASNLRWSWHRPAAELLESLPGARSGRHPVETLERVKLDPGGLELWLAGHRDDLDRQLRELDELERSAGPPAIAYFCPEFGLAGQLPQYSGGLGILAGDHLKASSDLGLGLAGVGLFYRKGFFRQEIIDHAQYERVEPVDPESVGALDTGTRVEVPVGGEAVTARVWQLWVGATRLLLLDTDLDGNSPAAREITDRLYAGDRRHRLSQELILGVGGVRALRALGFRPGAYHLNEGHACFLLLELLAEQLEAGLSLAEATEAVRRSTLFTTHTPVPAGIDRFERKLVRPELAEWVTRLGVSVDQILEWATLPSDGPRQPFNTAALAFSFCGRVNGVSQLHASVSRELFSSLPSADRVEGVTNGVHARTWVEPALQELYDDVLGSGWEHGDHEAWAKAGNLDRHQLGAIRSAARLRLVDLIESRTGTLIDPERCILGFARRFATYKRAGLLLRDPDGLEASLDAGAQFVFAGKAHPADVPGKDMLAEIARFAASSPVAGRIVLVPDYDIDIARALYWGCDVWLNNPIRPREACGTSGEKAALNGVLNCSISDGWWADWYTDGVGWVIPSSTAVDTDVRDGIEASSLHRLLRTEVLPLFGDGRAGLASVGWWEMVVAMLEHLGPLVTAGRMVAEYDRRFYRPILAGR